MARKRKHPEHVNHERWLVSYADFITLLFAFFTTLYAISTVDQKKAGSLMFSMRTAFNVEFFKSNVSVSGYSPMKNPPIIPMESFNPAEEQREDHDSVDAGKGGKKNGKGDLAFDLKALTEDPRLKGRVQVMVDPRGIVVSLTEAGFYGSGSAVIKTDGQSALGVLAERLAGSGREIMVEGHTDDRPVRGSRWSSNWELSTARATSVVAFFLERGFPPAGLSAAGYAEHHPVADNATAAGRARNRRIDIVIRPVKASALTAGPKVSAKAQPAEEVQAHE